VQVTSPRIGRFKSHLLHHYIKEYLFVIRVRKEFLHLTGEFEKQIKKLCLDSKAEKELIDLLSKATSEDPCMSCESKGGCENFKWHKKWLNTNNCNSCP
jgi:hypothetical protein